MYSSMLNFTLGSPSCRRKIMSQAKWMANAIANAMAIGECQAARRIMQAANPLTCSARMTFPLLISMLFAFRLPFAGETVEIRGRQVHKGVPPGIKTVSHRQGRLELAGIGAEHPAREINRASRCSDLMRDGKFPKQVSRCCGP